MRKIGAMQPHERYIAIGGEDWAAALGQDEAKYITPKVGIFLYGPDSRNMREQVHDMAFMSANAGMAFHPLLQIMDVIQERLADHTNNKDAASKFQEAIDAVRATARLVNKKL
jgi:hypothetical protein